MGNRVQQKNGKPNKTSIDAGKTGKSVSASIDDVKQCSSVSEIKPLDQFFFRRGEDRYESSCKGCRRQARAGPRPSQADATEPERVHDAEALQVPPRRSAMDGHADETAGLASQSDFRWMEHDGRNLGRHEKHDAVQRLNEFVTLLREGYGEIVGGYVYIRKD